MYDADVNTPKSELDNRTAKFQQHLKAGSIDGAFILQNTDLFYFAGTIQQSHLYIPAEGEPILMVRKDFERARSESAIQNIVPLKNPKQIPDILLENGYTLPFVFGMELDVLPVNIYLNFQQIFVGNESKIIDVSHAIRLVRAVKSDYELDIMRKSAQRSDQVADYVKSVLHEGITEIELAGKVEAEARRLEHQGIVRMRLWGSEVFYGHLMAGAGAAVPSFLTSPTGGVGLSPSIAQGASTRPIKRHEPLLVDYTFSYRGYLSDHTRIFSIGDLPDDLIKAHHAMLEVQTLIKKSAKPGVKAGELYDIAVERANELGYGENFMGVGKSRIRFAGHGIGLELDEYPFLAKGQELVLENNMTIAFEPKLIFPGKGVVGIENTHRVTDQGLEQFARFQEEVVRC